MMTKLYVNAVTFFNEFKRDERGVTAIEYGLIGVAMATALGAILYTSGSTTDKTFIDQLLGAYSAIATAIGDVTTASPAPSE
ncbi:Flp family type IVb pilin [Vibrio wakamikoensis]|jgi:pilus assembly protein Flp/PilA|uniref:Flp family type IVb pilin n=1 Tax=Vibrio wakamikoensis TaxID=2910251 RepID=UPI003D1CC2D8